MNDEIKRKLRERMEKTPTVEPFEATREFLMSYVADKDSMEEIEADIDRMSQINTRTLHKGLAGIEKLLASPPAESGTLSRLVAREVGWVLKDESDKGVKIWLGNLSEGFTVTIDGFTITVIPVP